MCVELVGKTMEPKCMFDMTQLKALTQLDLVNLLDRCAYLMNKAYEETLMEELFQTAKDAYLASNILHHQHLSAINPPTLH